MFWKYNSVSSSPQIEALLGKEDVTLLEVMDSDDIINECRVQNKALIDFLLKPNVMEELVALTVQEPSTDVDERVRFKYSNIACELLTCDVPSLNERLASDELLLEKLYSFLDKDPPLNPLLASFFSKIMGALIAKKIEQVLDFLKAKDNFVMLLLKHLGTSAVMDLALKLFTQVEGIETKQNILNWLDSQQVIQSLVSMFTPNIDKDRHYNVAQLLCDFIRIARDNQRNSTDRADPDPLLNTLESSELVSLLLEKILHGNKCESSIVGGIQVLLALLDVNQNSSLKFSSSTSYNNISDEANDTEQKQRVLNNVTGALLERMADFHNLLLEPPKKMPMELTTGVLDPPLGQTRLQVLKLFASVISSNNSDLLRKIISLETFPLMLDLFFNYPWNNFLHTQVERCLINALKTYIPVVNDDDNGSVVDDDDDIANALSKHLIEQCKLIERILEAWVENDKKQKALGGVRQGYMGHVINLLNELVDACAKTYFGKYVREKAAKTIADLEEFKEKTLEEVNKTQRMLLGGAHPSSSNNNDSGDFGDSSMSQSYQQQQIFTEYQMQYHNTRFIDGYSGFNDDSFNEGGDTIQAIDQRTDMNFDISDNGLTIQVFKQLCSQSINTLDDADDQIFEEKDHTFQTVIEKQGDGNDEDDQIYSSDSDDESPTEDNAMDVDPWLASEKEKSNDDDDASTKNVDAADPWNNLDAGAGSSDDANPDSWAKFSSATFDADFSGAFANEFPSDPQNDDDDEKKTKKKIVEDVGRDKDEKSDAKAAAAPAPAPATASEDGDDSERIMERYLTGVLATIGLTLKDFSGDGAQTDDEAAGDQVKGGTSEASPTKEPSKNTSEADILKDKQDEVTMAKKEN